MIIHDCEQRSAEWYALRSGIPTASEFSKLVTSKGEPSKSMKEYAITLAGEKFAGQPLDTWEGNTWTERGRELEEEALRLYEFAHSFTVDSVGFVTTDDKDAGCSPDGLVGTDGMVEVKCLKSENHIKAIMYHQKHGTCPTTYVQQTQGQMMICERNWCDLIFFHPVLPVLTIRQEPIAEVQSGIIQAIKDVLKERDDVLAALQEHQSPTQQAAE
jgi:hypothetical protein